jgi:hypothetical protein
MPGVDCGPGRQSAKPSLFVAAVPLGAETRINAEAPQVGQAPVGCLVRDGRLSAQLQSLLVANEPLTLAV